MGYHIVLQIKLLKISNSKKYFKLMDDKNNNIKIINHLLYLIF